MSNTMEILFLGYSLKIWEVLAVLGVVLSALEVFMPGFVLLPIGLAFGLTAVAAFFINSPLGILICLGLSLFFMIWLFTKKLKKFKQSPVRATNMNGLIGQELKITEAVVEGELGQAKLYGDTWTVYSLSKSSYSIGEKVKVLDVDGNKLIIK